MSPWHRVTTLRPPIQRVAVRSCRRFGQRNRINLEWSEKNKESAHGSDKLNPSGQCPRASSWKVGICTERQTASHHLARLDDVAAAHLPNSLLRSQAPSYSKTRPGRISVGLDDTVAHHLAPMAHGIHIVICASRHEWCLAAVLNHNTTGEDEALVFRARKFRFESVIRGREFLSGGPVILVAHAINLRIDRRKPKSSIN